MPNKKEDNNGRSQDRRKVAGGQDYEVKYEQEKAGASKEEVKESIKEVGNERKKVEENLKEKKK